LQEKSKKIKKTIDNSDRYSKIVIDSMSYYKIGGYMGKETKAILIKPEIEIYKKIKEMAEKEKRSLQRQAEVLLEKALKEAEQQ